MPHDRISCNPNVMMGKPVIKGMRVTVEVLLRRLGKGVSVEELMAEYKLSREDILAAQTFAADYLRDESILPAAE
ncbi:MAG: DUF433 domain-containing protein [Hyphomicrobiaceae bacterium]|nr:DUF433 domain-containing protein [Hyphomicrobiaceae bacterium]